MLPIILVILGMLCIVSSFGFEGTSNTIVCILGVFMIAAAVILIIISVPVGKNVHNQQKVTHFGGVPLEKLRHNDN